MSYYAAPYDYFPIHPRYPPPDLHAQPQQLAVHPEMHPPEEWCYGPPPPAPPPPMYPPQHYATFEYEPHIQERTSNLGNSFAIPKGTRNAMHRVTEMGNNIVLTGKRVRPQSVGATTTTTTMTTKTMNTNTTIASTRPGGMAASAGDVPIKSEQAPKKSSTPPTTRTTKPTPIPKPSCSSSSPPPSQFLIAPPAWKRMFETARTRAQGESGVAAPVVELASQILNKRCMTTLDQKRKFVMVVDATILRRGVLSSRSHEGMSVALYLFQPGRGSGGELVSTETMLCRMRIFVEDTRLLPANGMYNGVQINLLPALTADKFEKKTVTISVEARPEDFAHGLAMLCLRRLENPMCVSRNCAPVPAPVPSLLRRHSAPVRPAYPLIAPAALPTKRSASTLSASPSRASEPCVPEREEDDAVQVGDQIVSLVCPIALKRIGVPGKGRMCRHVQCFDLETFAKLSRSSPKWKCAVCNDVIDKTDLTVSEPFLHLLAAYPDAPRCIVRANGSHAPYTEPARKKQKRNTIVDLCQDEPEKLYWVDRTGQDHSQGNVPVDDRDVRIQRIFHQAAVEAQPSSPPRGVGGMCAGIVSPRFT
ncbi:hypothetical protein SpCBS45565_g05116 [Spizellomyces sp. 'palustris']|nr:hypothetical protein SpCBS45565_g05116 [Spizellomyces sp. 'palustris']